MFDAGAVGTMDVGTVKVSLVVYWRRSDRRRRRIRADSARRASARPAPSRDPARRTGSWAWCRHGRSPMLCPRRLGVRSAFWLPRLVRRRIGGDRAGEPCTAASRTRCLSLVRTTHRSSSQHLSIVSTSLYSDRARPQGLPVPDPTAPRAQQRSLAPVRPRTSQGCCPRPQDTPMKRPKDTGETAKIRRLHGRYGRYMRLGVQDATAAAAGMHGPGRAGPSRVRPRGDTRTKRRCGCALRPPLRPGWICSALNTPQCAERGQVRTSVPEVGRPLCNYRPLWLDRSRHSGVRRWPFAVPAPLRGRARPQRRALWLQ